MGESYCTTIDGPTDGFGILYHLSHLQHIVNSHLNCHLNFLEEKYFLTFLDPFYFPSLAKSGVHYHQRTVNWERIILYKTGQDVRISFHTNVIRFSFCDLPSLILWRNSV